MQLLFPFDEIRPIQKQLIDDVTNAISQKRCLLAHAPTGLGKTAATLSPALAYALQEGLSVFFLTPKHTQHQIAIETCQKIKEKHDIKFQVADLIGKKWMCPVEATEKLSSKEFNEYCKSLRAEERCPYFNNVWGKKFQLQGKASELLVELKSEGAVHAEQLIQRCKAGELCAYEIACQLARDAQVIIADYYHLFHPSVRQAFLARLKKELEKSIIIIDEGHNLPNRVREILTERLNSFVIKRAAKEAKALGFAELAIAGNYLLDCVENLTKSKLTDKPESNITKQEFVEEAERATGFKYDELQSELETAAVEIRRRERKSFLGSVADFLEAWSGEDVGFARILKKSRSRSGAEVLALSYSCLSPAISSADVVQKAHSAILMSGTLVPGELYRDLLGFDVSKTDIRTYPSPFSSGNRLVLIEPTLTTKFTNRNEAEFQKIAKECAGIISEVPNNCAVFFPSYIVLQSVLPFLDAELKQNTKRIFIDQPDFKKEQRASILAGFRESADAGGVLLAVQGGSFAEGIDLPGKYLQCAIVVGVPLASPDLETQALINYYDYKYNRGWDYGYIYPAMTRAIQAAGRCIRTPEDRGVVVFLDKRFAWASYLKCIPPEWRPLQTKLIASRVKRFFSN